ncbi:MAG: D-2-hydroxyacid dehydrogenase [Thermoanaerobaculia bacterium]
MRILVPGHFRADLERALADLGPDLVGYDEAGAPEAGSAGTVALFRWWLTTEQGERLLEDHPSIRWVHSGSAGVDHILTPRLREREIVLTTSAGVHAPSIAEWVVAAMLAAMKNLPDMARRQRERRFEKVARPELTGQTVVFFGAGHIATAIAERLAPFGVRMRAVRRSGERHAVIREIAPALAPACRDADWLIVAAPLTPDTARAVDAEVLAALPSSARLINVSRGELVDEPALVDTLRDGRIAGAILDVFAEEPLPAGHPFWAMENVLVLPHTTWRSPNVRQRQIDLFAENVRRFADGRELLNVVDLERGY